MKITRLVLDQVACFDHLELRFPDGTDPDRADVHLLVGDNGTGKSTILRALAQPFAPHNQLVADALRSEESTVALHYEAEGSAHRTLLTHSTKEFADGYRRLGTNVGVYWHTSNGDPLQLFRESSVNHRPVGVAAFAFAGSRRFDPEPLPGIREQTDNPLDTAIGLAGNDDSDAIVQWVANTRTKEALARLRGDTETGNRHRASLERLERAIREVTGSPLTLQLNEDPLDVSAGFRGRSVWLRFLPDGLKSLLSWVGGLLMRLERVKWSVDIPVEQRRFALFLDEIEVHLHPTWQWRVVPMLQTLFPNAQVFLATHSPFVVASASDAWVHRLEFDGDRVVARAPVPSRLGMSAESVLREDLGVEDQFAPEIEAELRRFRDLQDQVLRHEKPIGELEALGIEIANRGIELDGIVGHELRATRRALMPLASEP